MLKSLDKITGSALACVCLLNTGKPGTAPVSIAAFLRPAFKGVLGCTGNILNTCGSLVCAVFNIPALVLNPLNRRQTMYKQNVVDVVDCCVDVLEFLSEVAAPFPAPQTLQLSYKAQSGLSQILLCLSNRLSAASDAIQNKQTEMEVY